VGGRIMGRGIIENGLFRAERIQLEQRTTDPSDPDPNEEWLRVDIKPTYDDADGNSQTGVAEYRVANADGSVDTAPVAAGDKPSRPQAGPGWDDSHEDDCGRAAAVCVVSVGREG